MAEASRGCPGSDGASPTMGFAHHRAHSQALVTRPPALPPHADTLLSLPRFEGDAGRHTVLEHLAGH
jgi:hypothetical protein